MFITALVRAAVVFVAIADASTSKHELVSGTSFVDRSDRLQGTSRVHRGRPANIRNYPYMAAIYSKSSRRKFIGNGVILNRGWILVTAYEVDGYEAEELGARVGSNDAFSGGQTYSVSSVVVHSDYNAQYYSDIALLKTATKIIFTSVVMRATLAYYAPLPDSKAVLTGYGSNENRSRYILREANFTVIPYDACVKYYNFLPTSGVFCADSNVFTEADDYIGAPVLRGKMITGTFLGGNGSYPKIYNTILHWKNWISNQIKHF